MYMYIAISIFYIYIIYLYHQEIYYEGLSHAIVEAKFYNLLSVNWRPRKGGDVVPIEAWGPKN